MQTPPGIILIDKPSGITSFDVIRILQKKLNSKPCLDQTTDGIRGVTKLSEEDVLEGTSTEESQETTKQTAVGWSRLKIGHAGTLDPLATGLLVIGVGDGTKKLKEFVGLDKEYIADVLIGIKTTTGDLEGKVIEEVNVTEISYKEISGTLKDMLGTIRLPVSAYSAMKRGGKPMYKYARETEKKGEKIDVVPIRDMEVRESELFEVRNITVNRGIQHPHSDAFTKDTTVNRSNNVVAKIRFVVGSGTYIRSLAEELGKRLGYPATLYSLRRTKVGKFDIKDAKKLEDF